MSHFMRTTIICDYGTVVMCREKLAGSGNARQVREYAATQGWKTTKKGKDLCPKHAKL